MTDLTLKNLSAYLLLWAVNALAICVGTALAAGTVPGFGAGEFFAPIASTLAAGIALLVAALTLWLAANRPKLGREDISALVNEIGTLDARAILGDVVHGRERRPIAATDEELDRLAERIVARIEERMRAAGQGG